MKTSWMFLALSFIAFLPFLLTESAEASPSSLTYQGRILKSDGTPLEYNNVSFLFQITNPSGSCIIYQEQVTGYSMVNSGGVFDVAIGGGTIQYPLGGTSTVLDAFNNSSTFTCGTCSYASGTYTCVDGSSTYPAAANDGRKLRVSFYDGSGWKTISPDNVIRSVPFAGYAWSAQKLGANVASDFLLKAGLPTCSAGTFLSYNGSALSCIAVSGSNGGTVTSVSGSGPLSVATGSTTPVISIAQATTSTSGYLSAADWNSFNSKQSSSLADGSIWVGQTGTPTAVTPSGDLSMSNAGAFTVTGLKGKTVSAVPSVAGQMLRYDGTAWTPNFVSMQDLRSTVTGSVALPASCSAGQTLTYNSIGDNLTCATIAINDSQVSYTTSRTANTFLAAPDGSAGAASFRAISVADLPAGALRGAGTSGYLPYYSATNTLANSPLFNLGGKIGVGTATPSYALDVVGDINVTGNFKINGTNISSGGSGSVSSVGLSLPNIFTVSNSPVTSSGTLTATLASQAANTFLASPNGSAGSPSFRTITSADLPTVAVAQGGTGSTATLNNNRVMVSSGGAIVEASAITASKALVSDVNGLPTASAVTSTELGYLSGVTSSIQTQIDGKQASNSELTGIGNLATTGIVQRTGSGSYTTLGIAAPLNITAGNIGMTQSSGSTDGYLSSSDWTAFNGKVSSQWTTTGSDIYYNTGKVGIGTNSPNGNLDVENLIDSMVFGSSSDVLNVRSPGAPASGTIGRGISLTAANGYSGAGGPITITAGNAGGTSALGGAVYIYGGTAYSTGPSKAGGSVNLTGGTGAASLGAGGAVNLKGGAAGATGAGGAVNLTGGTPTDGPGGGISISGAAAATVTSTLRTGGSVSINTGAGVGNGSSGSVNITTATGSGNGTSGDVTISTGNTVTVGVIPGNIRLNAGVDGGSTLRGSVYLQANGGNVAIGSSITPTHALEVAGDTSASSFSTFPTTATSSNNYGSGGFTAYSSIWNGSNASPSTWSFYTSPGSGTNVSSDAFLSYWGATNQPDSSLTVLGPANTGSNTNSPVFKVGGYYYNGTNLSIDSWGMQTVFGSGTNPSSTLVFSHSGSPGTASYSFTGGNVGIGTATPGVALDVNGAVRPGSSTTVSACGLGQANGEGSQRYNYSSHSMEYCNGTSWVSLTGGGTPVIHQQSFTTSGSFTAPSSTTASTVFKFTVVGGGGGGGAGNNAAGAGGGAGGTAIYYASGLVANTGYSVTVGTGGGSGAAGNSSSVVLGGVTVTANGGGAGGAGGAGTALGGAGGTATNGTINVVGGDGGSGTYWSYSAGGNGGASTFGSGGAGGQPNSSAAGVSGNAYGSGGGGAYYGSSTGGNGANGIVLVEWVL